MQDGKAAAGATAPRQRPRPLAGPKGAARAKGSADVPGWRARIGRISILCLLDLSKCFDVIDHNMLLNKLQLHGVDTSWFASYLHGHTQCISFTDGTGTRRTS